MSSSSGAPPSMSLPSEEIEKSQNNRDVTPTVEHVQSVHHDSNGKLEELEVDIAAVLQEEGDFGVESEQSPLPEVRAVVPNVDDPGMPVTTFRMWCLGITFTILGSGINQFFSLRYPSIRIVSLIAELLAYPLGVVLAKILPIYTFNLGPLGEWCINPDHHFNIKEHTLITIMSNVSLGHGGADATSILQAMSKFYGINVSAGFSILIVLCCQMLGFGFAGMTIPWLVDAFGVYWPSVLSNCALLVALHSHDNATVHGWRISRQRFFIYVMGAGFIWYFFPGLIFKGLSYFTWICWIAPKNIVANDLFGMVSGLGMSFVTFDWNQIAYTSNPLLSPLWAGINVFGGFVIFYWICVPAIYYTNTWFTSYLPVMSSSTFDNTGGPYDVTKVLGPTGALDEAAYASYSPVYLSASFALRYGLSFASITTLPVHVLLYHGRDILQVFKGRGQKDIHARLMLKYKTTPMWWYAALTICFFILSIVMVEVYKISLPWWGVVLAMLIPAFYLVPCGLIQGITNINANQLNVLSELIGGYAFAGKPLANMAFKILSEDVVGQALTFAADMKLGHYMKISPRLVFFAQGGAAVLGALVNTGVNAWALSNVAGICVNDQQPNGFICPVGRTVFSSSIIWGVIGPARLYSFGQPYAKLLHFFWIGPVMPLITWLLWKKTKVDLFSWINWPLIFAGTSFAPPATGINYSSWVVVNFIFNGVVFKKVFDWWTKYNYVLAAALDTGVALSGLVIFFCISYPGAVFPSWWGNSVYEKTADALGTPWKQLPAQGYFGPAPGSRS